MSVSTIPYRSVKYIKSESDTYQPTSEWTLAKDVELSDGTNVDDSFKTLKTNVDTTIAEKQAETDKEIKSLKDMIGGYSIKILTQAQYDALATKDSSTIYLISE